VNREHLVATTVAKDERLRVTYVIGIDFGSQSIKGVLIDLRVRYEVQGPTA